MAHPRVPDKMSIPFYLQEFVCSLSIVINITEARDNNTARGKQPFE